MSEKPNIIIIMTDQQRADVSKREGFPLDTTPFLDSMAMQGRWFNHAYTASPLCVPARISMLTGRFPSAHGVRINPSAKQARYDSDLIDVVKGEGYLTAMIGKNHTHLDKSKFDHWFELGHNGRKGEGGTPEEKAFDSWLSNDLVSRVGMEPTPFTLECQGPYRAVNDARKWIAEAAEQPFFMWLSFPEPHNPYQVPEPYFSCFPPETLPSLHTDKDALEQKGFKWKWLRQLGEHAHPDYEDLIPRARSNYFGMLRLIDDQVKRFVEFLDEREMLENTILIFLSDHGDFVGEYGLMRKGPEMPELLMRIPMFFVGPGIKASSQPQHAFVSLVDIMPTLCEAMGVPLPPGVQGRSLWPLLTGDEYSKEEFNSIYGEQGNGGLHYTFEDGVLFEETLNKVGNGVSFDELNGCTQSGTLRMLRKGEWKLLFDMEGAGQLYNLNDDPFELKNLYYDKDHANIKTEMLEELLGWSLRMQDPLPLSTGKYRLKRHPKNYWHNKLV